MLNLFQKFNKENLIHFGFIIFIILIIYLFSIRPQKKKYNEQKKFLQQLRPGMNVRTIGGIHGIIIDVDDTTVTIELNNRGTNMILDKSAISINSIENSAKKNVQKN